MNAKRLFKIVLGVAAVACGSRMLSVFYDGKAKSFDQKTEKFAFAHQLDDWLPSRENRKRKETFDDVLGSYRALVFNNGSFQASNVCDRINKETFQSAILKTPSGNPRIFIHNPGEDVWVSGSIRKHGGWESDLMLVMWKQLKRHSNASFLDVGSHVGEYSLMAAQLGRKVVSFDPLTSNVKRLCKSVVVNDFTDRVIVINNAVSNTHTGISLQTHKGNIGGTSVIIGGPLPTIMLDDVTQVIHSTNVIMKLDVEMHEQQVLEGSRLFFKSNNVVFILMEWAGDKRHGNSSQRFFKFMLEHKMTPYAPGNNSILDLEMVSTWPGNVAWSTYKPA